MRLTVLYDEHGALCRACRDWLGSQRTYLPLELLAAGSPAAKARYGVMPWLGEELVVVNELGEAWVGPAAFVMVLWATRRYRTWSYRISGPAFAPMAERFFRSISKRRALWGGYLAADDCSWCENG